VINTPTVHLDNPNIQVTNSPNVQVTNTPNVNVANTPNVNVANLPAVQVSSLPAVQVSSLPAVQVTNTINGDGSPNPLVTQSGDDPARAPFRMKATIPISSGVASLSNAALIGFPNNTRAALQFVTLSCFLPTGFGVSLTDADLIVFERAGPSHQY